METEKPLELLLVEDDVVDQLLIRHTLEESGLAHRLTTVATPTQGLRRVRDTAWDCVLLDYRFPEGDSLGLFSEVLTESCVDRPPVLLLSGMSIEYLASNLGRARVQGFISKSDLEPGRLRAAIEQVVGHTRELRERAEPSA